MLQSKIKIIIADDCIQFCNILEEYFKKQIDIEVQGICHNGLDALKLIQEKNPDLVILDLIMPKLDGIAVRLLVASPFAFPHITKKLYALVAEKYNTTPSRVERAIRHPIEVSWNKSKLSEPNDFLGYKTSYFKDKPGNGEFIALISDSVRLQSKLSQMPPK